MNPRSSDSAANIPSTGDEALLCALIGRMGDGDETALGQLYGRTVRRVCGFALRVTRNLQIAEEVAEEVFWQVWRQALRFDAARGNPMAWLMTMTRSRGSAAHTIRAGEGLWSELSPGVQAKRLFDGADEASMLLRVAPGAPVPKALAAAEGEYPVIEGEAFVGDTLLRAGEYDYAHRDADDFELSSDIGALFYLHGKVTQALRTN